MAGVDILQYNCNSCGEITQEPFIQCCECDINLCMSCFSTGQEVRSHKNNHKYAVRKNDFPLFENCNWSAKEEAKLLTALSVNGYGNWEEIAKSVHTRSKLECQEHYKKYYIENVQHPELNLLHETQQSIFPKPVIPYLYNTDITYDPPRNNQSDQHLAGYNAYRSEFELSYDHNAESIFNIENNYSDDEDIETMQSLEVALVSALNTRLKERARRYKNIQNQGLIKLNKLHAWIQRYDKTLTRQKSERLLSFMQFMTGMHFDAFIESLNVESQLIQRLNRLREYRRNGIKTLYGVKVYERLKIENDLVIKEQKSISAIMIKKYMSQSPLKSKLSFNTKDTKEGCIKRKRAAMPLDIVDLPDFNLLAETEKNLCSSLRLIPKNYMEIKKLLIAENNKMGSLRLLEARRIVKIDVNKTRKIYDYLVSEGYLNKPR